MVEGMHNEHGRALATGPVSVIYVSIEEPQPVGRQCAIGPVSLLQGATACLHRMTDYVENLRRSLERYSV